MDIQPSSPTPSVVSKSTLRFGLGIGLSLLSALLLIQSFHPYNQWYLAFFALIPMRLAEYTFFPCFIV